MLCATINKSCNDDTNNFKFSFQAVSRWPVSAKYQVQCQASPCRIYGEKSSIGTGSSPFSSVFPCQNHSINHLPQALYKTKNETFVI